MENNPLFNQQNGAGNQPAPPPVNTSVPPYNPDVNNGQANIRQPQPTARPQGQPMVQPPVRPQGQPMVQPPVTPQGQPMPQPPVRPQGQPMPPPQVPPQTVYGMPQGQPVYPQYAPQPVPTYTPMPQQPVYGVPPQNMPYGQPVYPQAPPSVVYYNTRVGTAPQYHYGNPAGVVDNAYFVEQQIKREKIKGLEKKLRRLGTASGGALGICYGLALVFSLLFLIGPIADAYESSTVVSSFLQIVYTLLVVGGSFFIMRKAIANTCIDKTLNPEQAKVIPFPIKLGKPKNMGKTILLMLLCFGGCMAANIVSNIFVSFFGIFGLHPAETDDIVPKGVFDVLMLYFSTAVMPGLIEEFALRGVLMTPMRKYGNVFAIFASAFIFGVFHGTVSQIPFAFVCGIFFGYLAIITDSLWPSIIVHMLNNALSCTIITVDTYFGSEVSDVLYYVLFFGGMAIGVVALIIYLKKYRKEDMEILKDNDEELELIPSGKRFFKFATSPLMIVMVIVYVIQALTGLTTETPMY